MDNPAILLPRPVLLASLLAMASLSARAQGQSAETAAAFQAGQRWHAEGAGAIPWMPRALTAVAGGEFFLASRSGQGEPLGFFAGAPEGGVGELGSDAWCAGALGQVQVGAMGVNSLYSLAQFSAPAGARRTEIAWQSAAGSLGSSAWTLRGLHTAGWSVAGAALLAVPTTGATLMVAQHNPQDARVRLEWIAAADLSVERVVEMNGAALRALCASGDGTRFALATGDRLDVFDNAGGLRFSTPLDFASDALALSFDGRTVAIGAFGRVRVWRAGETNGPWSPDWGPTGSPSDLPSALALDRTGGWLAVGWWDFNTGKSARADTYDLPTHLRLHSHAQIGSPTSKQNVVTRARISADGRRAAFALWGDSGPGPELLLFDRDAPAPLLARDLPGSAFDVALDEAGTRVAVAFKAVHANDFGSSGAVRLYDTGERDVQLAASLVGGSQSALRIHLPGASAALLLVGRPASNPAPIPAIAGLCGIDPMGPLFVLPLALDGAGFGEWGFRVPTHSALVGLELGMQALAVGPTLGWSASAVRSPIL